MQQSNFNLIDVSYLIKKEIKQLLVFVFIVLCISTIVLFLVPKYYKSTAIIVAANPALADKARLFNNNIQGLYSNFGSGDDLDRIEGIANLDTTYAALVAEFNLTDYYKLKDENAQLKKRKAIINLKDDIQLQKTELGQFKIMVTTKNKNLSANIANKMVLITKQKIENIWQMNYQFSLDKINASIKELEDSVATINQFLQNADVNSSAALPYTNKREAFLQQLKQYYTTANEFKLAINSNAPALYIIENATPAAKHDKPKKLITLFSIAIISFVFACLRIVLVRKK